MDSIFVFHLPQFREFWRFNWLGLKLARKKYITKPTFFLSFDVFCVEVVQDFSQALALMFKGLEFYPNEGVVFFPRKYCSTDQNP